MIKFKDYLLTKENVINGNLSVKELESAEIEIWKFIQKENRLNSLHNKVWNQFTEKTFLG